MSKFEKVSFEQFKKAFESFIGPEQTQIEEIYAGIELPKRATKTSAGYDFFAPFSFVLGPGESITVPTGVRVQLPPDKFLMLAPRSGLGFRYRLQLDNTVGIIDSDYYEASNEGHIIAKLTNDSRELRALYVNEHDAYMQGIISQFFVVDEEDVPDKKREGGFGSTDDANRT